MLHFIFKLVLYPSHFVSPVLFSRDPSCATFDLGLRLDSLVFSYEVNGGPTIGGEQVVRLYEMYAIQGGPRLVEPVGYWSRKVGLQIQVNTYITVLTTDLFLNPTIPASFGSARLMRLNYVYSLQKTFLVTY